MKTSPIKIGIGRKVRCLTPLFTTVALTTAPIPLAAQDDYQEGAGEYAHEEVWHDTLNHEIEPGHVVIYLWDPVSESWTADKRSERRSHDHYGNESTVRNRDDRIQRSGNVRAERAERDTRSEMKHTRSSGKVQIRGTVQGFRRLSMSEQGRAAEDHRLVKIRLQDKDHVIVNLGPENNQGDLDVEKGDDIRLQGTRTKINDREVVDAKKITIDGETYEFREKKRSSDKSRGRSVTVDGTIDRVRMATVEGRDHLVARLVMRDRSDILVDLGPSASLSQFDLGEGDDVRIRGERARVDGKSILVANQLTVNGDRQVVRDRSD